MLLQRWPRILIVVGICVACSACSNENDVSISGAGATFPAPLYTRWFLDYYQKHPEVRVDYQAIGSGAGIRQYEEGLIHFGASDEYHQPKKVNDVDAMLLPMTAGSIVLCYNLPGGPPDIKLSRDVYVRIFLGEIETWNDPDIIKDNPGVTIPAKPINVVRRADSSGTTYVFTNHLSAISKKWKDGPGKGKNVTWPKQAGSGKQPLAGRGNNGVAAIIGLTPGAIGYTELGYAKLAGFATARLQNKAGNFISSGAESNQAALAGINLDKAEKDGFRIDIPDPEGKDAYPIVTFTWMILKRRYEEQRLGQTLKDVLEYCLTDGQQTSGELSYIPLPADLAARVRAKVKTIEVGSK